MFEKISDIIDKQIVDKFKSKLIKYTYRLVSVLLVLSFLFSITLGILWICNLFRFDLDFSYNGFVFILDNMKPLLYSLAVSSGLLTSFLGLMKYDLNFDSSKITKLKYELEKEEKENRDYVEYIETFQIRFENYIFSIVGYGGFKDKIAPVIKSLNKEFILNLKSTKLKKDEFIEFSLLTYYDILKQIYEERYNFFEHHSKRESKVEKEQKLISLKQIGNINLKLFSLFFDYTSNENLLFTKIITMSFQVNNIAKDIKNFNLYNEYLSYCSNIISKKLGKPIQKVDDDFEIRLIEHLNHSFKP